MVTGTNKTHYDGIDFQTSRNMIIVRCNGELSLINTVRLNEKGLHQLEALGTIAHVVRIGAFHGRDDGFYLERYPEAKFWALKHMEHAPGVKPDFEMTPDGDMPFENVSLFLFDLEAHVEAVLYLKLHGGILITCDSIQNLDHVDSYFSAETGKMFLEQGLIKEANIPETWIKACEPKVEDFQKLMAFNFKHLITAHGPVIKNDAKTLIKKNDYLKNEKRSFL